jgi:hypothetical protein
MINEVTNSTGHFLETGSYQAGKEKHSLLLLSWTLKLHDRVHKDPNQVPILSHVNSFHTLVINLFTIILIVFSIDPISLEYLSQLQ